MPEKRLSIEFPRRGINRFFGYQNTPGYSCLDALNIAPLDSIGERFRGGSRWGLSKAVSAQVSASGPVYCLNVVTTTTGAQKLVAVGGASSGPKAYRWSGSAWTEVGQSGPASFTFPDTSGYQITSCGDCLRFGETTIPDRVCYACQGWSHTYRYTDNTFLMAVDFNISSVANIDFDGLIDLVLPRDIHFTSFNVTPSLQAIRVGGVNNAPWIGGFPWFAGYGLLFTAEDCVLQSSGSGGFPGAPILNSTRNGMVSPTAWCIDKHSRAYVLSANGLTMYRSEAPSAAPIMISQETLPAELRGVDRTVYRIVMIYDSRRNGIHFFRTKISAQSGVDHFYLDLFEDGLEQKHGWWRMNYHTDVEPFCVCAIPQSPTGVTGSVYTDVLFGCRDGYVRRPDISVATDDGNAVTQTLLLGPFLADTLQTRGYIETLIANMAASSGTVTYKIYAGDSAEQAYANYQSDTYAYTGTWAAGLNTFERPNVVCHTWLLSLSSTSAQWAFEYLTATCEPAGLNYA